MNFIKNIVNYILIIIFSLFLSKSLLAEEFQKLGLIEVEVSNNNIESITEMLPNFSCFLLGRLTTLVDLHKELYGDDRMLPWVRKPENN